MEKELSQSRRGDKACVCVPSRASAAPEALSPRGQRSERRPEAGHPPLPPFPEGLLHQLALRGRVHAPEAALPWLVLRAGHFQKVAVERQVVSD